METFIPVLPKGRVGKDVCFEVAPAGSLGSPARETAGNNIEPTPVAPAVFRKSLRDQLFFFAYMFDPLSFPYFLAKRLNPPEGGLSDPKTN
jgi:hypothetical protein